MVKRILAACAHPDDETLGCGGTLLRHAAEGAELHWLIGTEPEGERFDDAFRRRREGQIAAVAAAYGFRSVSRLGFPTTTLDSCAPGDIIAAIGPVVAKVDPDVVYMVHSGDVHGDHRALHAAMAVALKPMRNSRPSEIYAYETLSSTNLTPPTVGRPFLPQVYVEITNELSRKLEILRLYEGEVFQPPHPRSCEAVEALARYRGASVHFGAAEAFMIVRKLWGA